MSLFGEVVAYLDAREVRTAVIGAAALAFRGVLRTTLDTDLLTIDRRVLTTDFWRDHSNEAEVRRGDFTDPLAGVVRLRDRGGRHVDLIVGKYTFTADVVSRAENGYVGQVPVRVARLADLVLLKLLAGGPKDAWDIDQALDVAGDTLRDEVDSHLAELPRDAQELWATIKTR